DGQHGRRSEGPQDRPDAALFAVAEKGHVAALDAVGGRETAGDDGTAVDALVGERRVEHGAEGIAPDDADLERALGRTPRRGPADEPREVKEICRLDLGVERPLSA